MSHFYSGIHGSRGPATRAGTVSSGIGAYVQSWQVNMATTMAHDSETGEDTATFCMTGGPSNREAGMLHVHFTNPEAVVNALNQGDIKMEDLRQKFYKYALALDAEAEAACKRIERRKKREQKAREAA